LNETRQTRGESLGTRHAVAGLIPAGSTRRLVGSRDPSEPGQARAALRLSQLLQAAGLDLAHALASDTESVGNLVEGQGPAIVQAESQLDDLSVAGGSGGSTGEPDGGG
jgi:hypothetical protein